MALYTRPLTASLLTSGLVGTLGYTVKDTAGAVLVARTTAGITEQGTGNYRASVANWSTAWAGFVEWDAGAGILAQEEFLASDPDTAALLDLADAVETGLTLRQALRLLAAACAGEVAGGGTTTVTIRNAVADSKNRITATVNPDTGDRTSISYDLS